MGDSDDDISLADFEVAQPDPIPDSWWRDMEGHGGTWRDMEGHGGTWDLLVVMFRASICSFVTPVFFCGSPDPLPPNDSGLQ